MKYVNILFVVLLTGSLPFHSLVRAEADSKLVSVINIGVLPDASISDLKVKYEPLVKYLSHHLNLKANLIIPKNYSQLLDMFSKKKIDLAYFGGVTYVIANSKYEAIPLVTRIVDTKFTSYFIVKAGDKRERLADFEKSTFIFGSHFSTSGHLMPRFFMERDNINPERFFGKIIYSGKHDETAFNIRDGVGEVGVLNSQILDHLYRNGKIKKTEVRILKETPPYTDYVWAIQNSMDKNIKRVVRDSFLKLSLNKKAHRVILNNLNAKAYIPVGDDEFILLRSVYQNQKGKQ